MELSISPEILDFTIKTFSIALYALGVVYLFGRMLNILKKDRGKNILAMFNLIIGSLVAYALFDAPETIELWMDFNFIEKALAVFKVVFYFFSSTVVYILFGWRLFWRVDSLLDKKVGSDEEFEKEEKK